MSVRQFDAESAPWVSMWESPVEGREIALPCVWDAQASGFAAPIVPTVIDRVLDDLASDPALVAVWQSLDTAQRTALRTRLAALLGRRRWRYATDPVDVED